MYYVMIIPNTIARTRCFLLLFHGKSHTYVLDVFFLSFIILFAHVILVVLLLCKCVNNKNYFVNPQSASIQKLQQNTECEAARKKYSVSLFHINA
jgi:hypothetical protein